MTKRPLKAPVPNFAQLGLSKEDFDRLSEQELFDLVDVWQRRYLLNATEKRNEYERQIEASHYVNLRTPEMKLVLDTALNNMKLNVDKIVMEIMTTCPLEDIRKHAPSLANRVNEKDWKYPETTVKFNKLKNLPDLNIETMQLSGSAENFRRLITLLWPFERSKKAKTAKFTF